MKELKDSLFGALIGGFIPQLLQIPFIVRTDTSRYSTDEIIRMLVIPYIIGFITFFTVIFLSKLIINGKLRAFFDLWHIGKLRGLWSNSSLMSQIEKSFLSSNVIKIKVTRGIELLDPNNEYGLHQILTEMKRRNKETTIQVLLIVPCFKLKHVQKRYENHREMTKAEFLKSWYEFMEKIKPFISDVISINVRFYFNEYEHQWRFYMVDENEKTVLWLTDYKEALKGSETPMYKIVKSNTNIAAAYGKHFNELWEGAYTPEQLSQRIESRSMNDCDHCTYKTDCGCDCQGLVNTYKDYLK